MADNETAGAASTAGRKRKALLRWAVGAVDQRLRHIMEVDVGLRCGCVCPSCGNVLEAVNSQNPRWKRSPHFRHHAIEQTSAQADACLRESALVAIHETLGAAQTVRLASRTVKISVQGVSGRAHKATATAAEETITYSSIRWEDRTTALLELPDGRQLRVIVVMQSERQGGSIPTQGATIAIHADPLEIQSYSPEELRQYLTAAPDSLEWLCHWDDLRLHQTALDQATQQAFVCNDLSRSATESILHKQVKAALERLQRILLPPVLVEESRWLINGERIFEKVSWPAKLVHLDEIKAEAPLEGMRPDIVALVDGHRLLIEVVIANDVDSDKLEKIARRGDATLAINLSGYRALSPETLEQIIVEECRHKRWIFHPRDKRVRAALRSKLDARGNAMDHRIRERGGQSKVGGAAAHASGQAGLARLGDGGTKNWGPEDLEEDRRLFQQSLKKARLSMHDEKSDSIIDQFSANAPAIVHSLLGVGADEVAAAIQAAPSAHDQAIGAALADLRRLEAGHAGLSMRLALARFREALEAFRREVVIPAFDPRVLEPQILERRHRRILDGGASVDLELLVRLPLQVYLSPSLPRWINIWGDVMAASCAKDFATVTVDEVERLVPRPPRWASGTRDIALWIIRHEGTNAEALRKRIDDLRALDGWPKIIAIVEDGFLGSTRAADLPAILVHRSRLSVRMTTSPC